MVKIVTKTRILWNRRTHHIST